jgi:Fe-S-cluster-containing dehydrogenase component
MDNRPSESNVVAPTNGSPAPRTGNPVKLWRTMEEALTGRPLGKSRLGEQFGNGSVQVNRQDFLRLMSASLALAGLTACAGEPKGPTHIAPYVRRPEGTTEEQSFFYASALTHQGYAEGTLVRQVSGRPIKVEGNPKHPASLGATRIFNQAQTLTFYDPDRSQTLLNKGQKATWDDLVAVLTNVANSHRAKQGDGIRVLSETVTSPSLAGLIQTLLKQFPSAKWHQWEPVNRDNVREGSRLAFGDIVDPQYHLDQADVILTLDAELLNGIPGSLRYARDFAKKRTPTLNGGNQNRLYAAESSPTITGMVADNRLPLRASEVDGVARAIAAGVGVAGVSAGSLAGAAQQWVAAVAKDLTQHKGTSLVVAGDEQPPAVHVLAHLMNDALGNAGKTVIYTEPVEANPGNQLQSLQTLVQDMSGGKVDFLLILGSNPSYTAPTDLNFGDALAKVAESVHLGLHADETAAKATWHVPIAHELEAWSDARAYDGTTTIIQPLINPLYGGRTPQELLAVLTGNGKPSAHDLVKDFWNQQLKATNFEAQWRTILNDGIVPNTAAAARQVKATATVPPAPAATPAGQLEVIFRSDPTIFDGRYANNGWLQELPKPLSKTTWDNAAMVSPGTASKLGLATQDVVSIQVRGKTVKAPIYVLPGHPDDAVTLHLGYGRTQAGNVGTGIGYNAYSVRTSVAPWFDGGATLSKTGETYVLATTQGTQEMEGRDPVKRGTLADFKQDQNFLQKQLPTLAGSLYTPFPYPGNKWSMSINLSNCIGCGACAAACVAENNIPVVGKDQVTRGRQMHWIRIDRYYEGNVANPSSYAQPVPCMQCENAPCEVVCPVDATTHSADGLNDMVYNRCVGTRYCSNNCPYKVRRFNFYQYADYTTPVLQLLNNPDVTVRERGVMEKCTYCVQRIRKAEVVAENESRTIRDGEVVTACQAACPTNAIVFGNANDAGSQVAKLKADVLNYDLLAELNTRPRTSYLGAVRNPNPDIKVE